MRLRVVVSNVRGFRDDVEALERLVGHLRPDLVLLNESGARWRLRRFARGLEMAVAPDPWSPFRRRVKNAVLVREPWRIADRRLHRFPKSRRWYPRGALLARIERPGARLWAASIHLGLHPAERLRHAREIRRIAETLHGPIVLGGDLNERPGGRAVALLSGRFTDAWQTAGEGPGETFPSREPDARIDYLFVGEGISVTDVLVPPGPEARAASDHLPVVADLAIEEPG